MAQKPIIDNSLTGVRSIHNTSCNWTGTADFGRLVPFHVEELDPTVKITKCSPKIEMQMLNLASPTFGKLDLYIHYFFVPLRLIWDGALNFFERQGPLKNSIPPFFRYYDLARIYDTESQYKRGYFKHWTSFGLPPFFANSSYNSGGNENLKDHLTALKFRAYQQIWWDFYRDPELLRDDARNNYLSKHSGQLSTSNAEYGLADSRVYMPRVRQIKDNWIANLFAQNGLSPSDMPLDMIVHTMSGGSMEVETGNSYDLGRDNQTSIQLRKLEALTRFAERLSLGGKRAIDAMFAAYGVKPDYLKLEMAQYLGGAKSTVLISDITSSADTLVTVNSGESPRGQQGLPLGTKAGVGYCSLSDLDIEFTAPEHGYLMGILSVMPHVHYVQGIDKSWFRNSVEDWFSKSLERTGQVAVSRKEIGMLSSNSPLYSRALDDYTFAFTQPYYELKRGQDILAGDFMYYHGLSGVEDDDGNLVQQLQYMQSMDMYIDFPIDRSFTASNLEVDPKQFDKVFYYLGGSLWNDVDDHFHITIDKVVEKDTPYDGYAVPTLETTKDPHAASGPVGGDKVL